MTLPRFFSDPATCAARLAGTTTILLALPGLSAGQSVDDPSRLGGVASVQLRAEAQWDELITVEAGGATEGQFLEALALTFRDAIAGADAAPSLADDANVTVACHVDTFYDTGLIVYSLRVQTEAAGPDGAPVITWIKSDVGSYTVQQLHLMFRLGEQCAASFLEDWRGAN
ncbi:MAG: hypothetical protein R3253_13445 [Longimicrobiales bacterium]|nr:hypothetical protein [Longimicrobiales bacterium]